MFSVVYVYLDHLWLCVLMVESMSVVVNVMLSLMSVMSPPPALCNLSLLLLGMCLWSVCEVVVVPYVDAVVAVTVMGVLLFVLHVCLLRECDGARLTVMLVLGMDDVWLW